MTMTVRHLTLAELHEGLDDIRRSPQDRGELKLIVRRPGVGIREELAEADLDVSVGLVGDTWQNRKSRHTADGSPHPDMQLNIMNARAAALVAQEAGRWALAGDQLFIDLDLSGVNLPPGTQIALGEAVVEVTPLPHTGCSKFLARFGADAQKFVNSPVGRQLNLRGINARVVTGGRIRVGDVARKL
jgi:MOSC domain-containing protein YiiM